jgi:hypothetical protein
MKRIHKNIFGIIFGFLSLSLSAEGMAAGFEVKTSLRPDDIAALKANAKKQGTLLTQAAIHIANVIDPANHRCCTGELPELIEVSFYSDTEGTQLGEAAIFLQITNINEDGDITTADD